MGEIKLRNLPDVIDQIVEVSTNEVLVKRLQQIKLDCATTAPEEMVTRWHLTSGALQTHIPPKKEMSDEEIKILSIFSTLPEEGIRRTFGKYE